MKTLLHAGLVFIFAGSLLACGNHNHSKKKVIGPLSAKQAQNESAAFGISKQQALSISKSQGVTFRSLNPRHGAYAFQGLSAEKLKTLAPMAIVFQNKAIEAQSFLAAKARLTPEAIGFAWRREEEAVWNNTAKTKVKAAGGRLTTGKFNRFGYNQFQIHQEQLNDCNFSEGKGPVLKLKSQIDELDLEDEVLSVELDQHIHLDATSSKPDPKHSSDLRIGILLETPVGSQLESEISLTGEIEFTPDAVGVYEVLTIVQDDRDLCTVQITTFAVTSNEPYHGKGPQAKLDNLNLFTHLDDVETHAAWKLSKGEGVIVAVIDSGVNYNHSDLRNNIYINRGEIPGNRIDDDNNGFVDDVYGYDLHHDDSFPFDDLGHGSHVAGLIAAETFGLAKKAKILPIKAAGGGVLDEATLLASVLYAADSGAHVVNMSFGIQSAINQYSFVIDYLREKRVLAVAASGNGDRLSGFGVNTDETPNYPSSDPSDNIISVAAKDAYNFLSPYSNYGKTSVDLTAPGGLDPDNLIYSTYAKNKTEIKYHGDMGTSMAAPIVAGVAAQVLSMAPDLLPTEVREIIMASGTSIEGLDRYVASGKTLNALNAVLKTRDLNPVEGGSH